MAYVFEGALSAGGSEYGPGNLLIAGQGDYWSLSAGAAGAQVLLLRGNPLREPVANHGPFVMNTPAEIEAAIRDYRDGKLVQSTRQDRE